MKIKRDGMAILNYYKDEMNLTGKIGVHGESMGGSVATYIGNQPGIDFMFADRTFRSLNKVARYWLGGWAELGFRLATCWTNDSVKDFVESKTYKVLGCDPNDTLVIELSSLKSGITREVISNELKKLNDIQLSKKSFTFSKYYHIITQKDTNKMLASL